MSYFGLEIISIFDFCPRQGNTNFLWTNILSKLNLNEKGLFDFDLFLIVPIFSNLPSTDLRLGITLKILSKFNPNSIRFYSNLLRVFQKLILSKHYPDLNPVLSG